MQTITTIGLDIAKSVFQVHGVDAAKGQVVIRRQLKRAMFWRSFQKLPSPCLVGIEACASSHHWSRELKALGHTVRLMPPAYVKPYVKRQKNDAADAEAICEAVTRANMRFVPTKTPEQQSGLVLHRTRHLFIRQQTSVINAIRAILPSSGSLRRSDARASRSCSMSLPIQTTSGCLRLRVHVLPRFGLNCVSLKEQILEFDRMIRAWHRSNETSKRSMTSRRRSGAGHRSGRQPLPIQRPSDQGATSRPGSGSCRSSTRAGARTGSAISANKAIAICAACSYRRRARCHPLRQDPWHQTSALAHGTCWRGGRRRSRPSRSPTRSPEWLGP